MERAKIYKLGKEIIKSAPQLYIDVDIEADGIAGNGSMLSIGAVTPHGKTFYSEIKPASELYIPENRAFCEKHGLERDRLLTEAPEYSQVMKEFKLWLFDQVTENKYKAPVFSAFNAAFDWSFVDLYFLMSNQKNPFGIAPMDLKSLVLPLTENWNWRNTAKGKLPSLIIPRGKFTHHALEDAIYQQKIHYGIAGLLGHQQYLELAA